MALFGTKIVEMAEVKTDGTLPLEAEWTELCKTYRDSVEVVDEDADIAEEYCDQVSEPIEIFLEAGKTNGKFSAYEYDPAILTKLMGGTVLDGVWTEGDNRGKDIALRFKTDSGHIIAWPSVKLFAKKNLKLVKKNIALIDVTFTPKSKVRISKSA